MKINIFKNNRRIKKKVNSKSFLELTFWLRCFVLFISLSFSLSLSLSVFQPVRLPDSVRPWNDSKHEFLIHIQSFLDININNNFWGFFFFAASLIISHLHLLLFIMLGLLLHIHRNTIHKYLSLLLL